MNFKELPSHKVCPICDGLKGFQPEYGEYEPCTCCNGTGYVLAK